MPSLYQSLCHSYINLYGIFIWIFISIFMPSLYESLCHMCHSVSGWRSCHPYINLYFNLYATCVMPHVSCLICTTVLHTHVSCLFTPHVSCLICTTVMPFIYESLCHSYINPYAIFISVFKPRVPCLITMTVLSSLSNRPTQSIMYVPLQENRYQKNVLLILQYKYLKSYSGDFYSPESDPPHKIMRYWFYYSIQLGFSFPPDHAGQVEMICTTVVPVLKGHLRGGSP